MLNATLGETAVPTPEPPPTPIVEEAEVPADYLDIAPDELMDLLSGGEGPVDESADLDAFWDTTSADEGSDISRGISLEEALERGLLDFNDDSA